MKPRKLGIAAIALQNLKSKTLRSVCLVFLVATLSFTLFSGILITYSLKSGMKHGTAVGSRSDDCAGRK
jgi:hypothetical protein